uniref:VWFA domain-containing protein n=1 Tax=Panagrolaimus superbus TaxID=310955 RepID=A0A914YXW1_9BILA
MQSAIDSAEQTTISYSLLQQFSSLATSFEILNDYSNQFGAMIFISDTSDIALKNADRLFSKLKGIRLTFILLGTNVDTTKLRNFTSNFIYWPDLTQPQPDNWDLISYHAYGCDFPYTPTSTRLPISTTSSNIYYNYYPCQVMITAIVDISNSLNIEQFEKQLTFTKNVLSQVNHFERVRFGTYYEGNGKMTYQFNSTNNQQSLLETIDATTQTSLPPSLAGAMRALSANNYPNRTVPDSTIIFVTDTTNPIQIQAAHNFYNSVLKGRVRLTFILTGAKANSTQLQAFDDAIFFNWQNMNKSQPDGWDISQAFRCTPLSSTTTGSTVITSTPLAPTTTLSTQGSSSSSGVQTSTIPSTSSSLQSTNIQTSATTPSSYIPCQSWISFGIDDSNILTATQFLNQLNFISSAIGGLNHPERIQAVGAYSQPATWNSGLTIQQIQNAPKITICRYFNQLAKYSTK